MKFLHTSDLHIGKKLDGVSRIAEQEKVLNEIISIVTKERIDIVLIAGDIYDTFIPSSEAENLFFDFIDGLSETGACVVAISGNHDDAERLSASETLASKRGVFLCVGENNFKLGKYNNLTLCDCGKNYLVFSDNCVECFIATVPYFGEAPVGFIVDKEKTYPEKVKEVLLDVFSHKEVDQKGILMSHLFMLGGQSSDGERAIDLGGVKVIPLSIIPNDVLYTALGHLHKRQSVSKAKNVIYSGSPLQYAYDEVNVEKSVTVFSIDENGISEVKEIELKNGVKLAKLSSPNLESVDETLSKYLDNFVDFTLFSDRPLTIEETSSIRRRYPNITKFTLKLNGESVSGRVLGRKHLSEKELFIEFIKDKYGKEPEEDLLSAYLEIMSEV